MDLEAAPSSCCVNCMGEDGRGGPAVPATSPSLQGPNACTTISSCVRHACNFK